MSIFENIKPWITFSNQFNRISPCRRQLLQVPHIHFKIKSLCSENRERIDSEIFKNVTVSNLKVAFIGSDKFSVPTLQALTKIVNKDSFTVVVSNVNNVVGKFSRQNSLKVVLWEEFKAVTNSTNQDLFDLGIVASFGYLIPEEVIDRFKLGVLNVHASLLPKYRGACPINHAIINGDAETGVSIMKILPHRFDIGPVYYTLKMPIHPDIRTPELTMLLAEAGAEAMSTVLHDMSHYLSHPIVQNDEEATKAKKITPDMTEVNWKSSTALHVYNLFRGLNGSYTLKTAFRRKLVVDLDDVGLVIDSQNDNVVKSGYRLYPQPCVLKIESLPDCETGHVIFKDGVVCVKCRNDEPELPTWVFVRKLKVAGKKWMSPKEFMNGFLSKVTSSNRNFDNDFTEVSDDLSTKNKRSVKS